MLGHVSIIEKEHLNYLQVAHDHLELEEERVFIRIFIIDRQKRFFDSRNEE